ncbi:MAG: sigma-70 family RNA polymerase sigma factor [Phycisphaerales bacterium]|nr:sigma-70 family RNA polymerase sigma factor [Phycisphaerales bacterium]
MAAVIVAHKPREVDLEDLLQDVAMTFVKRVRSLRDEEAFKPWLRTVAMNAARAAGREVTRRRRHDPEPRQVNDLDMEARDEGRRLLDLAADLPDGYREPLLLRCVRGFSYRRIAELLDLPETTVETRIARGRRMLRERAEETTRRTHDRL